MAITKKETSGPVKDVFNFIVDGHSNTDIFEYLNENGIRGAAAREIFEKALEKFMKSTQMPTEIRLGWCLEAYSRLYQKLLSSGDYAGALRAVQEIAKLTEVKGQFQKDKPENVSAYVKDQLAIKWDLKTITENLSDKTDL